VFVYEFIDLSHWDTDFLKAVQQGMLVPGDSQETKGLWGWGHAMKN
jgi:hypothetical protein